MIAKGMPASKFVNCQDVRRQTMLILGGKIKNMLIPDMPDWNKYEPIEAQYVKYSPNIVAAGLKIVEVYRTFCTGRAALIFTDCDDFGQIVRKDDELSKTYFKSILLHQALVAYNISLDLSWQVVWLYLEKPDLDLIYEKGTYKRSIGNCNFESLLYQLTLSKNLKLRELMKCFFYNTLTREIREKYNYYKHRGAFHIPELGTNQDQLMFSFNNIDLKCLRREEFDLSNWLSLLVDFHKQFKEYFDNIIYFVIPGDYLDKTIDLGEFVNYGKMIERYFNDKQCKLHSPSPNNAIHGSADAPT